MVGAAKRAVVGGESPEELERQREVRAERAQHLSDAQIDARVDFIDQRLDDNQLHANIWQWGWLTVNAAGMIVGSVNAPMHRHTQQTYDIIQASKGLVGTVFLAVDPNPGLWGGDEIRDLPNVTRADKLARLAAAEDLLHTAAIRARRRLYWPFHVANIAFNAIGGAILLGLEDYGRAAKSFGIGAAVGEVEILSAPWAPDTDWEEYERFATSDTPVASTPPTRWKLIAGGNWIGVHADF